MSSNNDIPDNKMEKDMDIDVGTLLASDYNTVNMEALKSRPEQYIKNLTRDNVQVLINQIWELPVTRVDEVVVATLPKPVYVLPRSLGIPKPKPLTKWERFAKEKGIQKKRKKSKKWDEQLKKWVPTYGYERAKAREQQEWLVEAKADGLEDSSKAAKERQSKNEFQRLRNIARAKNVKLPRVGLPTKENFPSSQQLSQALTVARASTASVGRFQPKLPKEKDAKGIAKEVPGLKRKRRGAPLSMGDEKRQNKELIDDVLKSKTKILREDYSVGTTELKQSASGGKRKKGGKAAKSKAARKPKGAKGERKKVGGRKRR
ncbi:hypothetical protein DMN91_009083 [Ooceraea biroi]|uniref:Ribosome biogenesis regulatory protein n=1 Tax=Ooceraea biroi TaxID=2015173 RepID=A0A026VXD7_OOCBI|nr:ribosome biogenesis regulatory protein homolog [Ooceraea biroi]EZA48437.1 Ribosome biogenesis regulatory protein-like protein [Ooceraea biroi]RLU18726.1 hypothetical protein DMN91_009083 [Ooceraea biroi]